MEGPFSQHMLMGWKQYLIHRKLEILHQETGILLDYDILISLLPEPKSQGNKQISNTANMQQMSSKQHTGNNQEQQNHVSMIWQQQQQQLEQKSHNSLSISNNMTNVYHTSSEMQQLHYNNNLMQNENVNDLSNKLMESQITHETNLSASASNHVNKSPSVSSINIKSIVPETKPKKWNFTSQQQQHQSPSQSPLKSHLDVISQHNFNNRMMSSSLNQNNISNTQNNQSSYEQLYNQTNNVISNNHSPSTAMSQVSGQEVISKFQPFIIDNSNDESVFRNEELIPSSVSEAKRDNYQHQYGYDGSDIGGDGDARDSSNVAPTIDNSLPTVDDIQSISVHNDSSQQYYGADCASSVQQQPQQVVQSPEIQQKQQESNQYVQQNQNECENEANYEYNQNYDVYGYNNVREDRNWKNYDHYRQNSYRRYNSNQNRRNTPVSGYSQNSHYYARKGTPNYPSTSREIFGNCHAKNRNLLPAITFDENTNVILEALSRTSHANTNHSMWSRSFERGCSILEKSMCDVLQYILQNVIGEMWSYITAKLPWSCKDMLGVMHKHWESNFRAHFPNVVRSYREEVDNAIRLFKQNNLTLEICFRTIVVIRDMLYCFELMEIQNSELMNLNGFGNNFPVVTYRQAYASLQKGREEAQALYEDCVNYLKSTMKNLRNLGHDNRYGNNYGRRSDNNRNDHNYERRRDDSNDFNQNYNQNYNNTSSNENYNTNNNENYNVTNDNYVNTSNNNDNYYISNNNDNYVNTSNDNYVNTGNNSENYYNMNTNNDNYVSTNNENYYHNTNEYYNTITTNDNYQQNTVTNENYNVEIENFDRNENYSRSHSRYNGIEGNYNQNNPNDNKAYSDYHQNTTIQKPMPLPNTIDNNNTTSKSAPSIGPYSQSSASTTPQPQHIHTANQMTSPNQNYQRPKTLHSAPSIISMTSTTNDLSTTSHVQSYSESQLKIPNNIKNVNNNNNKQEKPTTSSNRMGLQVDLIWIRKETENVKWKSMSAEHLLEFVRDMVSAVTVKAIEMKNIIMNDNKKVKGLEKITCRIKNIIKSLKLIEPKLHGKDDLDHTDIQNVFNALKDLITEVHVEAFRFCRKLQMPDEKYINEFKSVVENWFEEDPTKFERVIGLFEDRDSKLDEIIKESVM